MMLYVYDIHLIGISVIFSDHIRIIFPIIFRDFPIIFRDTTNSKLSISFMTNS